MWTQNRMMQHHLCCCLLIDCRISVLRTWSRLTLLQLIHTDQMVVRSHWQAACVAVSHHQAAAASQHDDNCSTWSSSCPHLWAPHMLQVSRDGWLAAIGQTVSVASVISTLRPWRTVGRIRWKSPASCVTTPPNDLSFSSSDVRIVFFHF